VDQRAAGGADTERLNETRLIGLDSFRALVGVTRGTSAARLAALASQRDERAGQHPRSFSFGQPGHHATSSLLVVP
jgi:hypothetical protein